MEEHTDRDWGSIEAHQMLFNASLMGIDGVVDAHGGHLQEMERKRIEKWLGMISRSFCIGNEPKSGLARDLGDCLQSRNVPFGTSGD